MSEFQDLTVKLCLKKEKKNKIGAKHSDHMVLWTRLSPQEPSWHWWSCLVTVISLPGEMQTDLIFLFPKSQRVPLLEERVSVGRK